MTVYKYLGYGVTNENGIAKLDHDAQGQEISHSYVGTGAGEIDVVASLDNPVVEGSIVSETYSILDALFYDEAISNAKASQYSDVTTDRSYSDNGTTLSKTATSGTTYCNTVIGNTKNWFDFTKKYQVDFDFSFERADNSSAVGIGFGSNGFNLHNLFNSALTGNGHLKIVTDGNTYQLYLDNVPKGTPLTITGNAGFFLRGSCCKRSKPESCKNQFDFKRRQ